MKAEGWKDEDCHVPVLRTRHSKRPAVFASYGHTERGGLGGRERRISGYENCERTRTRRRSALPDCLDHLRQHFTLRSELLRLLLARAPLDLPIGQTLGPDG